VRGTLCQALVGAAIQAQQFAVAQGLDGGHARFARDQSQLTYGFAGHDLPQQATAVTSAEGSE
jgi:hypothetical protein